MSELSENELQEPPVIFLLGPTACGKTASSIMLARLINAEIVSVDSALVYRGMDIGTAKPSMVERDGIEHHLIDICNPDDAYSAARFCNDALAAIASIHDRGKRALLTGGTMLYFKALEAGIAPLPDADQAVRSAISAEAAEIGWQGMHEKLQQVDPEAAARIHPNDPQRLQRALEVYELTGEPLTQLQKNTESPLAVRPVKFALVPEMRDWLHNRIALRFSSMLDEGFLEEVVALRSSFNLQPSLPSMRSVGYRQALEHLAGETDKVTMIARAEAATRQLAKRQLTWIRGMQDLHTINCDELSVDDQVATMLERVQASNSQ